MTTTITTAAAAVVAKQEGFVEHLFYSYFRCRVITYERIRVNMTNRHFEKRQEIFLPNICCSEMYNVS